MILPGTKAPEIALKTAEGHPWSLEQALAAGPILLAFFKVSCPTCQFTFPFLNRLAGAEPNRLQVMAISQDDAAGTGQFLERFAADVPTVLDSAGGYPTCKAFGISHVPSLFIIEQDGTIGGAANGFHKQMLEDMGARAGIAPFREGEQIPAMRPG